MRLQPFCDEYQSQGRAHQLLNLQQWCDYAALGRSRVLLRDGVLTK
jgi:hypothetical protein